MEARGAGAEGPAAQGATAGNSNPLNVVVSVTDTHGVPVTGLAPADFFINASVVGAGGSQVEISWVSDLGRGDYVLEVIPVTYQGTQYTWAFGPYILFLAVTHGGDRGQTLCDVFVH
jgi:hypothetical protein